MPCAPNSIGCGSDEHCEIALPGACVVCVVCVGLRLFRCAERTWLQAHAYDAWRSCVVCSQLSFHLPPLLPWPPPCPLLPPCLLRRPPRLRKGRPLGPTRVEDSTLWEAAQLAAATARARARRPHYRDGMIERRFKASLPAVAATSLILSPDKSMPSDAPSEAPRVSPPAAVADVVSEYGL